MYERPSRELMEDAQTSFHSASAHPKVLLLACCYQQAR
jgi:hypothetical protein